MYVVKKNLLVVNSKWPSEPLQLVYKAPLLIPSRMQGHKLARCRVMAMKYEHVIIHPVDLREGNLIISLLQERGDIKKVIGGLVEPKSARDERGRMWIMDSTT